MANATKSSSPRKRALLVLGGATVLFVAVATVAVIEQSRDLAPKFEPRPFFPDLQAQVNGMGDMAVNSKTGTFHAHLMGGKWVIAEKDSFPADAASVRATAAGLAGLEAIAPKTARPDWLGLLGLTAPDKGGDATEIKLTDTTGKVLADLLVGHMEGTADDLGRTEMYVRKPNENQTWLARGYLTPKPSVSDWLDKNVIDINQDRIKGATVTPPTGPSYTLARDSKDQSDFKLLDLPEGRTLSFDGAPDGIAGAIVGFTFDDVAKADQIDFSKAAQTVTNTFDGLDITVKITAKGMDHWAMIEAHGTNPKAEAEAMAINARIGGWAFKLPDAEVTKFTATRESLLKPPGEASKPTPH